MTRTSRALKRLGIAGLAVVTIGAGVPALTASVAQAAGPVASVTIAPTAKTGAAGVCLNYTLTARDAASAAVPSATITVTLSSNPANTAQDVDFCTAAQTGFGDNTVPNQPAPQAGTIVSNQGPQAAGATTDVSRFITDANGNVTIGVTSNVPGGANIQPFIDANNNGTFNAGELAGQSATATWRSGGTAGSDTNANAATTVTVVPSPDAAVVGEPRSYKVTISNTTGDVLAGVTPVYTVTGAETQGPTNCPATDNNGVSHCVVTFTKVGTSTVTVFVNQNSTVPSTPGLDPSEPRGTSTVTVQAAPTQGAQSVTATCQAVGAPATQTTTSPCVNEVNNPSRVVRFVVENTSTSNVTTTVGTLLGFAVTGGSGDETVTPTECSTADYTAGAGDPGTSTTNSFCDVTVNDPTPVSGEVLTVTGTIRGTTTKGSATVTFRNAPSDARNITLAPKTATTAPNTARSSTATVVDSLGKPVQGVTLTFTESGAGAFRNGSSTVNATTDANGQAAVEVISLPGETGTETITATIDSFQANSSGGFQASQCGSTSGATPGTAGTTPTGGAVPATQTAGNCSDTATNTYASPSPSPSATPTVLIHPRPRTRGRARPASGVTPCYAGPSSF